MSTGSCSRREFLKIVGGGTAAVAIGGGVAGLVTGCGGETATTTTAAPATPTTAVTATTTTAAPESTTTTAGVESGREVKIGVVSPQTGPLAVFGIADKWSSDLANKTMNGGVVLGDGKKHPITMVFRDTQSDSNRAAQVTGDLISNDKVDIIAVSGSPDTVLPAADTAEAMQTPLLSVFCPWSAFVFARGGAMDKPFKWTYGHLLGLEQVCADMVDVFGKTPTNKKVGFMAMNNADGMAWVDAKTGAPPYLTPAGYTLVIPSQYTPGAEDFTAQIGQFKKEGCEILTGAMMTPDFTNFWNQSLQQGFKPTIPSMALALGFPQAAEAVGPSVYGLIGPDGSWHPTFPFKDSLTGMTCQELADDYEKTTNSQWTGAIGGHAKVSWAVDVLTRAPSVDDKEAILAAITSSKLETILGPVDMTKPVDANPGDPAGTRPHPNITKPVMTGQQWVKGSKWPYECVVVSNALAPMVPVVPLQPMQYS